MTKLRPTYLCPTPWISCQSVIKQTIWTIQIFLDLCYCCTVTYVLGCMVTPWNSCHNWSWKFVPTWFLDFCATFKKKTVLYKLCNTVVVRRFKCKFPASIFVLGVVGIIRKLNCNYLLGIHAGNLLSIVFSFSSQEFNALSKSSFKWKNWMKMHFPFLLFKCYGRWRVI